MTKLMLLMQPDLVLLHARMLNGVPFRSPSQQGKTTARTGGFAATTCKR
jgi:hypothetical protein